MTCCAMVAIHLGYHLFTSMCARNRDFKSSLHHCTSQLLWQDSRNTTMMFITTDVLPSVFPRSSAPHHPPPKTAVAQNHTDTLRRGLIVVVFVLDPFFLSCSQLKHLRTYAEDALLLRDGSHTWLPQKIPQGGPGAGREAYLLAIAPEASCKEVS